LLDRREQQAQRPEPAGFPRPHGGLHVVGDAVLEGHGILRWRPPSLRPSKLRLSSLGPGINGPSTEQARRWRALPGRCAPTDSPAHSPAHCLYGSVSTPGGSVLFLGQHLAAQALVVALHCGGLLALALGGRLLVVLSGAQLGQ